MKRTQVSSVVSLKLAEEQLQILRLTTPEPKDVRGPVVQNDNPFCVAYFKSGHFWVTGRLFNRVNLRHGRASPASRRTSATGYGALRVVPGDLRWPDWIGVSAA